MLARSRVPPADAIDETGVCTAINMIIIARGAGIPNDGSYHRGLLHNMSARIAATLLFASLDPPPGYTEVRAALCTLNTVQGNIRRGRGGPDPSSARTCLPQRLPLILDHRPREIRYRGSRNTWLQGGFIP